ncbi:hypothetical protein RUND412_005737 [Rhizina undulata]
MANGGIVLIERCHTVYPTTRPAMIPPPTGPRWRSKWSAEEYTALRARLRKEILYSFGKAEKEKKPPIGSMFMVVFEKPSEDIMEQMRELRGVMERFQDEYQLSDYDGGKDSLNIPK